MEILKRYGMLIGLMLVLTMGFGCGERRIEAEAMAPCVEDSNDPEAALSCASESITDGIVYFDFDKFDVKPEYREVLRQKAELLKQHPTIRVRIEGNCDERGTQEYNLALGERRARAVYEYLVMLGVNPEQLDIISYGKERPAVEGTGPEVWAKNRRDDFRVISK